MSGERQVIANHYSRLVVAALTVEGDTARIENAIIDLQKLHPWLLEIFGE